MLYETYRPKQWAEVVGQDKAIERIDSLMQRGLAGRAYWISGNNGTGKTTIARLIAAEVADDFFVQEVDATNLTPARLRDIEAESCLMAWGKGGRAFIVNEAHGMRRDAIRQLLVMLERIRGHVVWVFTTTRDGQDALFEDYGDACPLLSRCIVLALTNQGLSKPFAQRAMEIAHAEHLDGQPSEAYVKLEQKHKNNLRSIIQAIDSGDMQR